MFVYFMAGVVFSGVLFSVYTLQMQGRFQRTIEAVRDGDAVVDEHGNIGWVIK